MKHLLVTNDFPPKIGGIQSYLWELWRRLPPESFAVLTTAQPGADRWDAGQPFTVHREPGRVLLPTRSLLRRIDDLAAQHEAEVVLLDPVLPLGLLGRRLERPYGVVLHGAEVTVPGRLPGARRVLAGVLGRARFVVAAGRYPLAEAERAVGRPLDSVVVPPGVDTRRFRPSSPAERRRARIDRGLTADGPLVVGVSRLVPRKGFDVLIPAVARVAAEHPGLELAIAGDGRDRRRLERAARRHGAPVAFLGRVADDDLAAVYGMGDVFAMVCRNRWGGLEQEGFGIVFLEAAACGVPQVAGASGGAAEAVADGDTGLVVDSPRSIDAVAGALGTLLDDPDRRRQLAVESRRRAESSFAYDLVADRLATGLAERLEGPHG